MDPAGGGLERYRDAILEECLDDLFPVVKSFQGHIVMQRRSIKRQPKYLTPKDEEGKRATGAGGSAPAATRACIRALIEKHRKEK